MTHFEKRVITAFGNLKRLDIKDAHKRDLVQSLYDTMRENADISFDERDRLVICQLCLELLPEATQLVSQAKTSIILIQKTLGITDL